jgi:hypothetical protein
VLLAGGGDGAAGDVGEARHAEVDCGAPPGKLVELGEFLPGGGEADLQAVGLAEPAFALGFVDAGLEVVAQAGQPWPLGRVSPQQRAPNATGRARGCSWTRENADLPGMIPKPLKITALPASRRLAPTVLGVRIRLICALALICRRGT